MKHLLSPNYSHGKLVKPSFSDLIDVFEDSWNNYVFAQVKSLMALPHGDVAAITILCAYYEAIQSYKTGKPSIGKSRDFFVKGFIQVFNSDSAGIEKSSEEIYKYIRCSLAHEGLLSRKVNYSRDGVKAFYLTYPKRTDGTLDVSADVKSIIVNPILMYEITERHFKDYIKKLRKNDNHELRDAFRKNIENQWGLGLDENIAGLTEAEFLGNT